MVLVGGGPGDPELISVAGRKALMEADVVVADRLAPRELLGELPADVELIDVAKLPRGRAAQQEEINRILVDRARAGKRVVRFKGGDNFVFGRGFEEVLACRGGRRPGHRDPGADQPDRRTGAGRHPGHPPRRRPRVHRHLRPPAARAPRLARRLGRASPGCAARCVLMMAVENAPAIADALLGRRPQAGHPGRGRLRRHHAGGAHRARRRSARSRPTSRASGVQPPAIIVVGEVVAVAHPERYGPR